MPFKKSLQIIMSVLIAFIFLQLVLSLFVYVQYKEIYPPVIRNFLIFSIALSVLVFTTLHYIYFLIVKEKNNRIKRLYNALMNSLKKNEELTSRTTDLEGRLRQSQKLDSIGSLAQGMAHDFNNLLSPIMGYSDLALSRLSKNEPLYLYINEIVRAATKGKNQVEQILEFTKHKGKGGTKSDLNGIIEDTVAVLRPLIPSTVQIKLFLEKKAMTLGAGSEAVKQILVNLCTNGWQSMEKEGGKLTISSFLYDDDTAAFSIEDTGVGIDRETRKHMFEPFYSTLTEEKSSGMGLSVVQGILTSVSGRIEIDSTPGIGSTFTVFLPLKQQETKQNGIQSTKKSGFILLVDDDINITTLIGSMLREEGYQFEVYNNSTKALKAFQDNPNKYNMILSDLTMPNLTGMEMKKEIQKIRQEIPVLIMTGYGDKTEFDYQKILKKPFVKKELLSVIMELLQ